HCAEESGDLLRANFDVVVEKQDRLVAKKQVRSKFHEASNSSCFGSALNSRDIRFRVSLALMIVVEENVVSARLFKIGCVKPFSALDEDEDVAVEVARLAFDAQPASGIE